MAIAGAGFLRDGMMASGVTVTSLNVTADAKHRRSRTANDHQDKPGLRVHPRHHRVGPTFFGVIVAFKAPEHFQPRARWLLPGKPVVDVLPEPRQGAAEPTDIEG